MKKRISHMGIPQVLLCLLGGVVVTLPFSVTGSKYVWQDDLQIILKVDYDEQNAAGNLSVSPETLCTLEGTGIWIKPTGISGQWFLRPEEGYLLPETFTVEIGGMEYVGYTDGQGNPQGISYDAETGILTISDCLLENDRGRITVIVNGLTDRESVGGNAAIPADTSPERITATKTDVSPDGINSIANE